MGRKCGFRGQQMWPELQVSLCTFLLVYVRMIIGLRRCKGSWLF